MVTRKVLCFAQTNYIKDTLAEIAQDLPLQFTFKNKMENVHNTVLSGQVDMLILQTNEMDPNSLKFLTHQLKKSHIQSLLFLATNEQIQLLKSRFQFVPPSGWHFASLPILTDNLIHLIVKLTSNPLVQGQRHTRYETNQYFELYTLDGAKSLNSKMLNLSFGGLQCEFKGPAEIHKGDFVRLNFNLNELNRRHSLNAKVVWMDHDNRLGLEFVSPQDMYRHMLGRV